MIPLLPPATGYKDVEPVHTDLLAPYVGKLYRHLPKWFQDKIDYGSDQSEEDEDSISKVSYHRLYLDLSILLI